MSKINAIFNMLDEVWINVNGKQNYLFSIEWIDSRYWF